MRYTILGSPLSPFVRKVRVFCAEKGIAYDLEPINPFSPPDGWREISPLGRIPVLTLTDDYPLWIAGQPVYRDKTRDLETWKRWITDYPASLVFREFTGAVDFVRVYEKL